MAQNRNNLPPLGNFPRLGAHRRGVMMNVVWQRPRGPGLPPAPAPAPDVPQLGREEQNLGLGRQESSEELQSFLRMLADKEKTANKNNFAQKVMRRQRTESTMKKSDSRRQSIREKFAPVLLLDCISALFNNPRLSDVTLRVGPHTFHAHRLILCAWSEYFRSLTDERWVFSSGGAGDEPQVQTLSESKECEECFEKFLRFMYTEKVDLNEENIYPMLMLADKYLVHDLRDVCEEYLLLMLDTSVLPWEDALKAVKLTEGLPRVQEKCFSLLENNFHTWRQSRQDLSEDLLMKLLSSSKLVIPNETFLFEEVMAWLQAEEHRPEREELTEQALSLIRFEHVPACDLVGLPNSRPAALRPLLEKRVFDALSMRALAGEEAYFSMHKAFSDPRVYTEPVFCVRITNSEWKVLIKEFAEGELAFKQLNLFTDDSDSEFTKFKVSFPVARAGEEKNVYLIDNNMWDVGGLAIKQDDKEEWTVRYIIKPNFEDIGRSYRIAILTYEEGTKEEQMFVHPVTCVDEGDVGKKITIDIPPHAYDFECNPQRLWIQVAIFVSGCDRSWDK